MFDTIEKVKALEGKIIQFGPKSEELEDYCEDKIRAKVLEVKKNCEKVFKIKVDYGMFSDYNMNHETYNYYNKTLGPFLSARQAGFYKEIDEIYLPHPEDIDWSRYFHLIDQNTNNIITAYNLSKKEGQSYIEWLEEQFIIG